MNGKAVFFIVACATWVATAHSLHLGSAHFGDMMLERSKRQAPQPGGPMKEMNECCPGMPSLLKEESKAGCFPPMSNGPPPPPTDGKASCGNHSCWVECAFKKQNLVTPANVVDMAAVSARVDELVAADSTWSAVIKSAYDKCKDATANVPADLPCKSGAGQFHFCYVTNLFTNCPDSVKKSTGRCPEILSRAVQMMPGGVKRSS